MADDVHVEAGGCRCPEGAMGTLEDAFVLGDAYVRSVGRDLVRGGRVGGGMGKFRAEAVLAAWGLGADREVQRDVVV